MTHVVTVIARARDYVLACHDCEALSTFDVGDEVLAAERIRQHSKDHNCGAVTA